MDRIYIGIDIGSVSINIVVLEEELDKSSPHKNQGMRMRCLVIGLFIGIIGYVLIFSPYGMVKIIQLRCQIHKTQTEIAILQGKEVALEYEINLLEHDTSYINYVAKEKFGIK